VEAEAEAEVEAKAETAMDAPEMGARIFISATRSRVPRDSCEKHGARRTSGWPRVAGSDLASCCSGSPLRGKSGRGRRSRRRLSRHPRPRSACTQHRSPVSRTDCSPPLARWRARPPPCAASPIRTPWKASRLREVPASAPARVSMCAESVLSWGQAQHIHECPAAFPVGEDSRTVSEGNLGLFNIRPIRTRDGR
jgi:hypothetical protein